MSYLQLVSTQVSPTLAASAPLLLNAVAVSAGAKLVQPDWGTAVTPATAVTALTPPAGPVLVVSLIFESTVKPPLPGQCETPTGAEILQVKLVGELVSGDLVHEVV